MKSKLTITVESELIPTAKRYAHERGVSLSSLIEGSLREMVSEETESFSTRWRGKFAPAPGDDPRFERLARKYL